MKRIILTFPICRKTRPALTNCLPPASMPITTATHTMRLTIRTTVSSHRNWFGFRRTKKTKFQYNEPMSLRPVYSYSSMNEVSSAGVTIGSKRGLVRLAVEMRMRDVLAADGMAMPEHITAKIRKRLLFLKQRRKTLDLQI